MEPTNGSVGSQCELIPHIEGNMRHVLRLTSIFTVSVLLMSCAAASQSGSSGSSRGSRSLITQDELADLPPDMSAFDAVRRLRSTWMSTRGMASLNSGQTVQVYMNNVHLGGLDFLRSRSLDGIVEIRYHNGRDATTRWGTGVGGGVIELITAGR